MVKYILKKDTLIALFAFFLILIGWLFLFRHNIFQNGRIVYLDADIMTRYDRDAERLRVIIDNTISSGKSGILKLLVLSLPFSPSDEKPGYIYFIALIKEFLYLTGFAHPTLALTLLNISAFFAILISVYCILRTLSFSGLFSLTTVLLIMSNYSLTYHTFRGTHTIFGIAIVMISMLFKIKYIDRRNNSIELLIGLLHGYAILISVHVITIIILWHVISFLDCLFKPDGRSGLKRNIAGIVTILILAQVTHDLHLLVGIRSFSPILALYSQHNMAVASESTLNPTIKEFFGCVFEYYIYNAKILLLPSIAFVGFLSLRILRRSKNTTLDIKKLDLKSSVGDIFLSISILSLTFHYIFLLPTIGRAFIPSIIFFILGCIIYLGVLLDLINLYMEREYIGNLVIVLITAFSIGAFFKDLSENRMDGNNRLIPVIYTVEPGQSPVTSNCLKKTEILKDISLEKIRLMFVDELKEKIVKIDISEKFCHDNFVNCQFEILVANLVEMGLKPIKTSNKTFQFEKIFENEHFYFVIYKGKWTVVYQNYRFLKFIKPDTIYFFNRDEILDYIDKNIESLKSRSFMIPL